MATVRALGLLINLVAALNEKDTLDGPDTGALNRELASQLQACVQAVEAKQSDSVIGVYTHSVSVCTTDNMRFVAQAGGQEVWEAIQTMVKNVSEAMLTPLPNFWRISKSFMEGRYKKVGCVQYAFSPRV